jgi:choline dehydrogenase-like flavoprotein
MVDDVGERAADTPAAAYDYDVLVIGSGFGGSVAALRLTEKGYRVGVLEAGRRFADADYPGCCARRAATADRRGPRAPVTVPGGRAWDLRLYLLSRQPYLMGARSGSPLVSRHRGTAVCPYHQQ